MFIQGYEKCHWKLGSIYVGNTPDDFVDDSALLCQRNISINGLSEYYLAWCKQPVRGQYVTIRNHVFMQQDVDHPDGYTPNLVECFSLCEVRIYVNG